MRILIATGIYPPSVGGPATYSKTIYEELPKHGFETAVLSFDETRHLPKGISHLAYFFKLLKRSRGYDVVYAQDPVSVGVPAFFVSLILNKRFILKVVGDYAWEQGVQRFGVTDSLDDFMKNKNQKYQQMVRFLRFTESFVAWRAETVIVPSQYLKKIVSSWGIPKEKIKVIYNAFEGISEDVNNGNKRINLSGVGIVSAGRLVPWKGFMALVETMVDLTRKFPELKLYIIGDGPEKEVIERRVKQLELSRNVFLVGNVSQPILFEYIRQSKVFVLNTGYEGFSHQLLEVLAIGIPIVTTNIGGNPEVINDKENGLLVPYNDKRALSSAVEKILRDEDFASNMVSAGKDTVSMFTKERMVGDLIKVLE